MKTKVVILLNKTASKVGKSCPTTTKDVDENVKNRNYTIRKYGYGPLKQTKPKHIIIKQIEKS